ncbi:MAG TPA: shikimate dehydrogenase [Niabella sp.]|nr:shikimate dehydrogenase [Niabella sp.]HOZ95656.1 shikimate dehydrogenase [Niabella sp.]HQW13896.1 shikimate dehydrogenase [Niabella sp.]HQX19211.1 shikimate dehydrogenase [Niabella sp.]HQX42257.1 shikimate dehydrogenase [Niabella sp.]
MNVYGLIGMPLVQSFSKKYFTEKFEKEGIGNAAYELFPIEHISLFPELLQSNPGLLGLNVTIPYKEQVLPFLNELSIEAEKIKAVNCIKIKDGQLKGFNTDAPAFKKSLLPQLQSHHKKALILGTGGAAKAVLFVLESLGIEVAFVSRSKGVGLTYEDLNKDIIDSYPLIINSTPLGSFPKVETAPTIPYELLTPKNYLYDLVYNPAKTLFLQKGEERGASIKNGYEMLVEQAELSWQIWNNS